MSTSTCSSICNTTACLAPNDASISKNRSVAAPTTSSSTATARTPQAGPYTLSVNVASSGQACSAVPGPSAFNPKGKLGDACAYPGHEETAVMCNPNLGSGRPPSTARRRASARRPAPTTTTAARLPGGELLPRSRRARSEFYCLAKLLRRLRKGGPGQGDRARGTGPTGDPSDPSGTEPGGEGEGDGDGENADPTGSSSKWWRHHDDHHRWDARSRHEASSSGRVGARAGGPRDGRCKPPSSLELIESRIEARCSNHRAARFRSSANDSANDDQRAVVGGALALRLIAVAHDPHADGVRHAGVRIAAFEVTTELASSPEVDLLRCATC